VSWRSLSRNFLALFIGIVLSIFLLEGLLRIFEPIQYRVVGNKIELPRDKKYHFINDQCDKLDRVISTSWNHMGFRGELPPHNFADCLTIIAIGGSTTECTLISDGKTWCDILAAKLKEKFNPLWLNNGGLNGHSSFGNIISMQDYVVKIRPKVVLFLIGANDIGLNAPWDFDQNYLKKNPVRGLLGTFWEGLINHSRILSYAINFQRYYRAKQMGLTQPIFDFAKLKQPDISPEKIQALLQEHRGKYLKGYAGRLSKLIEISRSHGIEPVMITQPMVFGNLIDPYTGVNLAKPKCWIANGEGMWKLLELYNGVMRETARQHHVHLIDLARQMPKSTEFYYDTYHYTNAGCRKVAEIVYQGLEPFLEKQFPQYIRRAAKP
jgi:lysophospholipase L1-like esterase